MTDIPTLRNQLLQLHKALLHYQRAEFEQNFGVIKSPDEFFRLVLSHPAFAWLRTLSELIAGIDEMTDAKESAAAETNKHMQQYVRQLLSPRDVGSEFEQKYVKALQIDPGIALLHGKLMQELNITPGL